MTVLQVAWLAANSSYVPLCQLHPSFAFTSFLTIDATGGSHTGITIAEPPAGPLSGGETRPPNCPSLTKCRSMRPTMTRPARYRERRQWPPAWSRRRNVSSRRFC